LVENCLSEYFPFIHKYSSLTEILNDRELASLGDAYVNLIYSLALSRSAGRPIGRKLDSRKLSLALRKAGIRALLPCRMDRHRQADAAEALIVFGWLSGLISTKETLDILAGDGEISDKICIILKLILERIGVLQG